MEELFETVREINTNRNKLKPVIPHSFPLLQFHDELAANEHDEEGHEEDEERDEETSDTPQFNVPQAIR